MATRGSFFPYQRRLRQHSRTLRRDPTPAERKLWFEFLRDLPAKFTRQKPLACYIADFYCASRKVVVEIDGDSHFTPAGSLYDAARSRVLQGKGLRVLRFTNEDVLHRFEAVCIKIAAALE